MLHVADYGTESLLYSPIMFLSSVCNIGVLFCYFLSPTQSATVLTTLLFYGSLSEWLDFYYSIGGTESHMNNETNGKGFKNYHPVWWKHGAGVVVFLYPSDVQIQ